MGRSDPQRFAFVAVCGGGVRGFLVTRRRCGRSGGRDLGPRVLECGRGGQAPRDGDLGERADERFRIGRDVRRKPPAPRTSQAHSGYCFHGTLAHIMRIRPFLNHSDTIWLACQRHHRKALQNINLDTFSAQAASSHL